MTLNGAWFVAVVPNLLVAAFSLALGYFAWRDSSKLYRRNFAFMVWLISFLALVLLAEKVIDNLDIVVMFALMEYVLEVAIIMLMYMFVMEYSERTRFADGRILFGLLLFGSISPILLATNEWHHLFYTNASLNQMDGFVILNPTYGSVVVLWAIFAMGTLAVCLFVLMASYLHAPKHDKRGFAFVSFAIFSMMASTVIYWFSSKDNPLLDILAMGLFAGVFIVYYGVFWRNILDAPPFTILQLLENVYDGAVLIDENGHVAYWNTAAREILTEDSGRTLPTERWYKDQPEYELRMEKNGRTTIWNVKASIVKDAGKSPGTVLVLSDITEMRLCQAELHQANSKLSILQSVNRHDLRNDMVALCGYLELMGQNGHKDDPLLLQAKKVMVRMNQRIEQLKDLPDDEGMMYSWQDAEKATWEALHHLDTGHLDVKVDLKGLEVHSDQLLERIIYNLAENTVRHGKNVRRIAVTYRMDEERCVICFEDDGRGIASDKKELIFEKGYGENTGMGLFLTREIARNTGMTIRENGTTGARFELTIPAGRWRSNGTCFTNT